jgi:hypothetical protein
VGFLVTFWKLSLGSLDEMWRGVDLLARKEKLALQSAQSRETSIFSKTSKKITDKFKSRKIPGKNLKFSKNR